ncbi:PAS domain-containing protein [Spirosoma radiotolerans]|uniref:PAS domain-containing protein n=1 Tax=Spirosoma radiotolerans TaxID=1379870 RepID=UPI0006988DDD|nr:PAS domain-containing protein [Spirosoma radiotolerans]
MLSALSNQLSLSQLFDQLPDNVVWMRAVRQAADQPDESTDGGNEFSKNQIVDFVIDYANPKAQQTISSQYLIEVGTSIRHGNPAYQALAELAFHQLRDIVDNAVATEFEYFDDILRQWLLVTRSKAGDGVLSITRVITKAKELTLEAERQRTLLDNVLNTSLMTVFVYEAIRDEQGQILDFSVRLVNERARASVLARLGIDIDGKTLLDVNPDSRQAGQFNLFCQVIESGQPIQVEQFYSGPKAWYNTSITKLNDGVVVMGNDITEQKQIALETERQRTLLDGVLNASQDAILVLEAIRDEQGKLTDFRFTHANSMVTHLLSYSIDTVLQHTFRTLYSGPQETTLFNQYRSVTETGLPYQEELAYTRNGQTKWYRVSAVKLGDGVTLSITDITKTQIAEKAIIKSATDLQAVIDIAQTGIFVISPVYDGENRHVDFRFEIVNRTLAALVDQTPARLQGTLFSDWFTSYRDTPVFEHYKQVLDTREDRHFEINYAVDGLDEWFDVKAVRFNGDVLVTFTNYTELKRVQHALEQTANQAERQAELLNSVLNGSSSGVIAFEAIRDETNRIIDFSFLAANRSSTQMINKKLDEMIGSTLLTIFPGNVQTGLFDLYVRTTETGEPGRTEVYYNHDGLDFWLDIFSQKLSDGLVVTFTDISATKRSALTIEQSADELRTVIDSAQVAIFLINPVYNASGKIADFRFRTANQMIASYVGQEPDALMGELVSRWFPEYLTNGLFQRYVAIFETGRTQHFNFHSETNSLDAWESYTVVKVGADILVTFSDFTELKKLQQRLEASATELQTVIDTCQTGIFLFSPVRNQLGEVIDFRFRLANRQLASYVGQEPEVVVGALGSTWFPDYKTNGLFERYHKTYMTGESQRFDFHYDGSGIDVWLDIMTTKSGDDVLVTFGDYTPLKQLQQQLENSVIDLQRSNKNLEQFAYIASHDLQEPLRKIQAFGDIIQSQFAPVIGDSGADMIARMQSAAARMQILIKDVLAYSRIATKRESIGPVNLNQVVADVLVDIETAVNEKNAVIKVESMPTVRGDSAQLRQLFQNLISNALKFTKTDKNADRPTILITSRRIRGRDLTGGTVIATDADRLFHLIEIDDNGIGFDPHQAERIFQVFQRLHGRSEYQGTGIGLAIVQKVVENHQGHIVAEGRPGQGSTFRILLPV